jgi:hypothetical protein
MSCNWPKGVVGFHRLAFFSLSFVLFFAFGQKRKKGQTRLWRALRGVTTLSASWTNEIIVKQGHSNTSFRKVRGFFFFLSFSGLLPRLFMTAGHLPPLLSQWKCL